ncbi:hypothetical protein LINGRAPRIM_LOCUS2193 [Linum grandiflorum]
MVRCVLKYFDNSRHLLYPT